MKDLGDVRQQLAAGDFEFSRHALRRVVERNISEQEIRDAGAHAEPIESYLEDKYSPREPCCWVSRRLDARCTFKYR